MNMNESKRPVVVTTEYRGVFFGYLEKENSDRSVVLTQCRNCIKWTTEVNGFGGLAVTGPLHGCKIGPAIPKIKLEARTAILECTQEAESAWRNFK
jgi:hypothetical protein